MISPVAENAGFIRIFGEIPSSFLDVGELVKGKIARINADGTAIVGIKGKRFHAEIPANLKTGSEITLQVRNLDPKLILSLVEQSTHLDLTPHSKHITTFAAELTLLLERVVQAHLDGLQIQPFNSKSLLSNLLSLFYRGDGAVSLQQILSLFKEDEKSKGVSHEKMRELMSVMTSLGKGEASLAGEGILDELESFFKLIDIVRYSSQEGLLPLPFLFDDELGVALLNYQREGKKEESGEEAHLLKLSLEMSSLGQVETSVRFSDKGMMIVIKVANEEISSVLRDALPDLRGRLEDGALDLQGLEVISGEKGRAGEVVSQHERGKVDIRA